jgi:putative peptidoglycan lipid II flippase
MGFRGLALGTAAAAIFNAIMLLVLLRKRVGGLDGRRLAIALTKICVASAAMGIAVHYTSAWLAISLPGRELPWKLLHVFGAIAVGMVVLAAAARLLRISEFDEAVGRVLRRLRATPPATRS